MYMLGLSSSIRIAHMEMLLKILPFALYTSPLSGQALQSWTTGPCYIAPGQIAQKTSLPLSRVLLLPGKQRVHRAVP
jgi:hypothetical protein